MRGVPKLVKNEANSAISVLLYGSTGRKKIRGVPKLVNEANLAISVSLYGARKKNILEVFLF